MEITINSAALRDNQLGDPHERTAAVYLPAGYDEGEGAGYPMFVALAAFGGSGFKLLNWQSFGESLPQRIDRLISEGEMGPVVLVMPDGFTRLGGNQWIDSPVLGRWEAHVLEELIPEVEAQFDVKRGPAHRAVFGHSSGGYAALIHAMKHGEHWGAVASHSGDVGFELVYGRELPGALASLAGCNNDPQVFLDKLWAADKIGGRQFNTLMLLAMAATYAPEPDAPYGIRLPVDPDTCERDAKRWARWLAHDPLELAALPSAHESMQQLRGLYLDCGSRDEYFIHFGCRALARKLVDAQINHVYQEFDGGHSGVSHRLDVSLPFLYRALNGCGAA
ncbi:putative esterase [Enhygromyxa salina]|uniref:Putative esterase n=1 Tax=Enhygromyxa salina TaxID=215803 RepID=A0A0C2D4E3_9BACT|nr:putative esterase [Enhygromyxa salina]